MDLITRIKHQITNAEQNGDHSNRLLFTEILSKLVEVEPKEEKEQAYFVSYSMVDDNETLTGNCKCTTEGDVTLDTIRNWEKSIIEVSTAKYVIITNFIKIGS